MSDYITVPIGKRCILVLTREEWQRGIRRGKARKRRESCEKRQQEHGRKCKNSQC